MDAAMTIELKGLRFYGYHGLHEEEGKAGNAFEVEVKMTQAVTGPIHSIDQTANYVQAYGIIKEEMEMPRPLLETLAQAIGDRLHEAFPSSSQLTVSIQKLSAPLPNFIGSVGVTYTKEY